MGFKKLYQFTAFATRVASWPTFVRSIDFILFGPHEFSLLSI